MDAKKRPCRSRGETPSLAALAVSAVFATVAAQAQILPDVFPPAVPGYGTDPGVTVGMTTVTASLIRGIEDAAQEGVAGYAYTGPKLTLDYEWRRDLLLQTSGGVQRADLLGGGAQTALRAGIGATWLVNRRVRVTGTYDFGDTRGTGGQGSGLPGSFTRSLGLLTVRLAL